MTTTTVDMGGDDLVVDTIAVGATTPGAAGSVLTSTNLGFLSVTAGTATASKAVVLDASKNIATLGTVGCDTVTLNDAANIVVGGSTGTKIGTSATAQKLGFFNATPAVQPTNASQGAVTTTVSSAVATTSATNSTPYGYAQAQADAIVTNLNAVRVDVLALATLVNRLRTDLVALGLIKGS